MKKIIFSSSFCFYAERKTKDKKNFLMEKQNKFYDQLNKKLSKEHHQRWHKVKMIKN